jgi:hypothetical protein
MFDNWLQGVDNKYRILIRLALIWSLWLCRNELVFNGKNSPVHFFARFVVTSIVSKLFMEMCTWLEQVARDISIRHG